MENKTKLGIGFFITLALAISGTYYWTEEDPVYYCESRDLVGICEKLSSGIGTRCYFNESYKTCSEGWKRFEGFIEPDKNFAEEVEVFANGEKYVCKVSNGEVWSYTNCISESNKFAYMGELI